MARRRMSVGVVALLAVALVAMTGCGSDSGAGGATTAGTAGPGPGPIEGAWTLTRYASGGALRSLPAGLDATLTFADGRVNGSGPVNSHRGPYTADPAGGSLSIGPLASTQIGGPPEALTAETDYLAALGAARSYAIAGDTLTIRDAAGTDLLVLAEDARTVVGSWTVTGYNNGAEAVVSTDPDGAITAEFGEDGSLGGDSGVNRYRTTYEISSNGGGITIGPPAGTRKAGPPALMEQERLYLAALESAATFTLQGDTLTLRDASDAIAVTLTRS